MFIVGELINSTRKEVKKAIEEKDKTLVQKFAVDQFESGADFIDINTGVFLNDESDKFKWIIDCVFSVLPKAAICIDSSNPRTIEIIAHYLQGISSVAPMVNSISLEANRYDRLMPLVAGTDFKVIALCMSNDGMPESAEQRMFIADKLVNGLVKNNVDLKNIYVDPLVHSLGTNYQSGIEFLTAVKRVTTEIPGVHTICGLSNISFGLPVRSFLNQIFFAMAIVQGLSGAIFDPLNKLIMGTLVAAEAIVGKDEYCINYLKSYREKLIK